MLRQVVDPRKFCVTVIELLSLTGTLTSASRAWCGSGMKPCHKRPFHLAYWPFVFSLSLFSPPSPPFLLSLSPPHGSVSLSLGEAIQLWHGVLPIRIQS